jgi:acetoin utilization deacetylase AcuC-like enzyme
VVCDCNTDVHHGNGTQEAFWSDPDCLFVSIHQDNNYPRDSGAIDEIGASGPAAGATINIPLPPGSGTGCYAYAFKRVIIPALERFKPDMIFVSSGFDASYADPLASMMLSSEAYRHIAADLLGAADRLCGGRIVFAHEGGYSKDYVPFCAVAVIETLCGVRSGVEDPDLDEVRRWGYQACQPHQAALVNTVASLHSLGMVEQPLGTGEDGADAAAAAAVLAAEVQELEVTRKIQGLLDSIIDGDQRRLVLNSLHF